MQFFEHNGKWFTVEQIKRILDIEKKARNIICPYCVTQGMKHLSNCPSIRKNFNKENAHELTIEEREDILKKINYETSKKTYSN